LRAKCILSNCTCDCNASLNLPQVGKGRSYTPSPEDVGSSIKCEIVPVDSSSHFNETGAASSASTGRVRPVPLCPQRALVPVPPPRGGNPAGKFTALTYNLLADLYASVSTLRQLTGLCSHSMHIQHLYSFDGHVNCPIPPLPAAKLRLLLSFHALLSNEIPFVLLVAGRCTWPLLPAVGSILAVSQAEPSQGTANLQG